MNDALSGRAPVSIHMEDNSEISFLSLVSVGSNRLAVVPAAACTSDGTTNRQYKLCILFILTIKNVIEIVVVDMRWVHS